MKLTYEITVCNEFIEIQRLMSFLLQHKRIEDNIVIFYEANGDPAVEEYLRTHSLNGEFIWHKINQTEQKTQIYSLYERDYVFRLDLTNIK